MHDNERRSLMERHNNGDNGVDVVLNPEIHIYRRRWWLLAVFCYLCTLQGMIWNTWGPVASGIEATMQWTDSTVALFNDLHYIVYLIGVIPGSMLVEEKGLRLTMIASTGTLVIGTGLRCFSLKPNILEYMSYTCALLSGAATIIPFGGPPMLASVWFPPRERPVAIAIASFFNYFGLSLSFIVGPQFIPDPVYGFETNVSNIGMKELPNYENNRTRFGENVSHLLVNHKEINEGTQGLLFTHLGLAIFVFALVLVYFPSEPPKPPSFTASLKRTDYKRTMGKLIRNGPFWMIILAGGITSGFTINWIAIIDIVLKPFNVSQIDAGWMGFWHTVSGCFSGILFARYSDILHRKRKFFLLTLYACAALSCFWFALLCSNVIDTDLMSLYASTILLGIFITGSIPLLHELAAEVVYPVSEGVVGGIFTMVMCVFSIVFLSCLSVRNAGIAWINWTVLAAIVVPTPLIILFPEKHRRTDLDLYLGS